MNEEDSAFYYMKHNKTLLVGMPRDHLLMTQNDRTIAYLPIQEILKAGRLSIKDIEQIAFTTQENFEKILDQEQARVDLYDEFMEYIREKRRRQQDNVLNFKANTAKKNDDTGSQNDGKTDNQ